MDETGQQLARGWGRGFDKTWLDSGCILKAEPLGLADESHVKCDRKRRVESSAVFLF